ncbi:unnamed protein product [Sphagnum jensenii]|uniref:Protein kinase domain-containing protein n=1 Tax=Sphagnum jensenii TaxID=128206 RepID=A0ABP0WU69_9BRYO
MVLLVVMVPTLCDLLLRIIPASPQEVVALLAMKHAFHDPRQELRSWNESGFGACSGHWAGIKCAQGQVIAVTLPNKALAGSLATQVGELASLRKLNLHNNLLGGELPTSLVNLHSLRGLYLFRNNFSGVLPTGLGSSSPLLQALDLSYNHFSGPIPDSVSQAPKLLRLDLSNNRFNGTLPAATWGVESQLQYLNVSSNLLSGSIPAILGNASTALTSLDLSHNNFSGSIPSSFSHLTSNLTSFNVSYNSLSGVVPSLPHNFSSSAFIGNPGLCGYNAEGHHKGHRLSTVTLICVALGSALAGVAVVCCILLLLCRKERIGGAGKATAAEQQEQQRRREPALGEGAGLGKLVHFDGAFVFTAEDLLGATAVVLGKSSYGTVYKATLENGKHIAVKRLREGIVKPQREFESEVKTLGRIRHPNLLALRAYYWGPKDEKLLVFDFVEGGTLAAFLHGKKVSRGPEKALNWRTRVRIAAGTARGLLQLHVVEHMIHGNLTASNILVDNVDSTASAAATASSSSSSSSVICPKISEYGISRLMTPAAVSNVIATAGSSGYHAPELTKSKKPTTKSDVYSFGILLLELLTGKAPADVSATEGALDLPDYVAGIVKENWTAEVFDVELLKGPNAPSEEELMTALQLAMRCVTNPPSDRPEMYEILRNLEDLSPQGNKDHDPSSSSSK